MTSLQS